VLSSAAIGLCGLVCVGVSPLPAEAQLVGVGPRFSFVRGDLATDTPSSRLMGGSVRLRSSARTSLELSMDYRITRSPDLARQTRETPVQASLLVMPFRTVLTPYALAGVGVYTQRTDVLGVEGDVTDTSLTRRVGWHAGFGGEFSLGRHAAVYADYRYRFVTLDRNAEGRVPFSHQGSMWTSGVAFYF
jgi:opacity protein-like surface antigen